MRHLLYLMFRCDFDVTENLENLKELNTAWNRSFEEWLSMQISAKERRFSLTPESINDLGISLEPKTLVVGRVWHGL